MSKMSGAVNLLRVYGVVLSTHMPAKQCARRQTGNMTEDTSVATRSLYDVGLS